MEMKVIEPESAHTQIIPLEKMTDGFEALTRPVKEEIKILVQL